MKTTVFKLDNVRTEVADELFQVMNGVYRVPSLPAYAILHTQLDLGSSHLGESLQQPVCTVEGDEVRLLPMPTMMSMGLNVPASLTVSYSGIRDHALLFPHVENLDFQTRLGEFAEEAEKAFDAAAWMSFVLMAGAVIEGLLVDRFGKNKKFHRLIELASEKGIFTDCDMESLNEVRAARNRVHAERFKEEFVGRSLAMDVHVIYDRLVKHRWDID